MAPLSRLLALIVPYGGFSSGTPSTFSATYPLPDLLFGGIGQSAPAFSPGPRRIFPSSPAVPAMSFMSETSSGARTSPIGSAQALHANAYTVCVSGSYAPPGQFVPPEAVPTVNVPSVPSILLSEGGVYTGPR